MSTATKLSYSVAEAVEATGLSKSSIDRAIRTGDLKVRRTVKKDNGEVAGNRVIRAVDLQAYIDALPEG